MSAMRSEPGQKSHHLSKDGMREKLLQRAHKFFCFVLFSFSILIEIIIQKQMQLISCFFDKSIRDLIIIWELTAQLIHSLVFLFLPLLACCLSGHDLGPGPHTDCAISYADSAQDPLPLAPLQE